MKRWRIVIAAMLLLSGCSNQIQGELVQGGEPAWKTQNKEEITLQWYVNSSWFSTPWGNNAVSKKITEDTGVSIDFMVPTGSETTALDALITGDNLPDLITLGWWEPQVDLMVEQDMVYALNELADTHDPYFWKVGNSDSLDWYTKEDGNVYGYPNSSLSPKDYETHVNIPSNQTFLVRKDIYEAIGSPDMTTPAGFQQALRDALEQFPEVNGQPLLPFGSHEFTEIGNDSFDKFLMNFLAIPYEENGQFYDRYIDEEYKVWLNVFRELYQEGLLTKDIFFDKRNQVSEKIAEGRYFALLYQYTDMQDQQKYLYDHAPEQVYIAVDGPKNSKQDDPTLTSSSLDGWMVTMISKKTAYPERAIALLSYLISDEGQKLLYLGIEDEMYTLEEERLLLTDEVKEILARDRVTYVERYGADNTYWMLQDLGKQMQWKQPLEAPMEQLEAWTYPYVSYSGQYNIRFPYGSEEAQIGIAINTLWAQTLPTLLLAPSKEQFDTIYDSFVKKREALGYEQYMLESTRQMQQAKLRLGMQ
ncbi:MAG: extracellular solute-binding protein [Erysipelotrichaceae bacterium]